LPRTHETHDSQETIASMSAHQPHHPFRRRRHFACLGSAIAALIATVSLAVPAGASTAASASAAAVLKSIAAAPKITSIPSNLTPSLKDFADASKASQLSGVVAFQNCDGYNNASQQKNPKPCVFGNRHAKKTIVLVGDSFVGNWTPALKVGLKTSGYKLDVFGYAGCPTPDLTYRSNQLTPSQTTGCNKWHLRVPAAIRKLHPVAVIAVTGEDFPPDVTTKQWTAGFKKLFTASTGGSSSTIRIVMGTSPFLSEEAPDCLAAHSNPQDCNTHYTASSAYGEYLARDATSAKGAGATLIPTFQWFCAAKTCSTVIAHYLAFADTDHVTVAYSDYIAPLVTNAVLAVLQRT
jgi:SGNH domain (fused to AT3 domains)